MKLVPRDVPPRAAWTLEQAGVHPLLARLYAARGVTQPAELDDALAQLLDPGQLKGARDAARLLADAIAHDARICIVADYDCDGATACAVAVRGLHLLGAQRVDYLVPNRVEDGYGLTPAITDRVADRGLGGGTDWLITVDNGIASVAGVARARQRGLRVLVTDHHLPGPELPEADAIVNPNQPGCGFASKALAGVGVMFYVLLALRAELRKLGAFADGRGPRLDALLPLVALGTVADVVRLDANNRRLVAQGLKRIRLGHAQPGVLALLAVAGRKPERASTFDLGFALGPRLNAAGRLADMTLGIELLLTDDQIRADDLARQLDAINRERRTLENQMREQADAIVERLLARDIESRETGRTDEDADMPSALSVFDPEFHEGVVGLVAARLKDRWHRPTFVFAPSHANGDAAEHGGELKGSGRSIPGFHLRDALDEVAKRCPDVLLRFGGHAMAAGCSIRAEGFAAFQATLAQVAREWLDPAALTQQMATDGPLPAIYRRADVADALQQAVWGQGFAPPLFSEELEIVSQRLVGQGHLALKLRHQGEPVDGIWFGRAEPLPPRA
ncbi:MAG: single-stranded-DNA-specific exonuclease RecJ, partial [Burkholderiaceae bacterium]|nr:single-stranded-DNA-specific exonuclease RecJ [Burkholderiaceae bacterium]